ncbi:hypothetical protein V1264_018590 [Littorina saxatilis]
MASAVHEVKKDALVSGIKEINHCLQTLLSGANEAVKVSTEHFIDNEIAKLFGLATAYKNVLHTLKLQKKVDLDQVVEHHYRYQDVREVCDDWKELELQWDDLLKDVDKKLDRSGPDPLTKGQVMSLDEPFLCARTKRETTIRELFKNADSSGSGKGLPTQGSHPAKFLVLILLRHFA